MKRITLALALVVGLAGCGGANAPNQTTTGAQATTTGADTTSLRVYFLRDGKVGPVGRGVPRTQAVAASAMQELLKGPLQAETGIGLTTAIPAGTTLKGVTVADGVATVGLSPTLSTRAGLAQVVYTLTQFPTVTAVRFEPGGKAMGRADFEAETPRILVESPLPFDTVSTPVRLAGTADTFEANFMAELDAADGTVLDKHFVTATSGSGTRGTYATTLTFPAGQTGSATVKVWEASAENGQPLGTVEIPVQLG
jgi:Immunoglobulin-like domain of bacterial spore germination/Sporulation and spore germination